MLNTNTCHIFNSFFRFNRKANCFYWFFFFISVPCQSCWSRKTRELCWVDCCY